VRVGVINSHTGAYRDLTDTLRDGAADLSFERVFPQLLRHLKPVIVGDREQ
jgi:hypothetical protein